MPTGQFQLDQALGGEGANAPVMATLPALRDDFYRQEACVLLDRRLVGPEAWIPEPAERGGSGELDKGDEWMIRARPA